MRFITRRRGALLVEVRKPGSMGECKIGRSSGRPGRPEHVLGFTLVELLVTVAIAVVLIMLAVPSFRTLTLSNKLTTSANDIVNAIHSARMEAVKRNASTLLCSNSSSANTSDPLGSLCDGETGAVYLSSTPPTQVLAGTPGITEPIQLNGDMAALHFTAQGLGQKAGIPTPYGGKVVDICTSQMSTDNHRVIMMTAGSILVTTTTSGACPSP